MKNLIQYLFGKYYIGLILLILIIYFITSCSPRTFIYTDMSVLLNNSKGAVVVTAIGYDLEDNCFETIICDSQGDCKTLRGLNYKVVVGDTLLNK